MVDISRNKSVNEGKTYQAYNINNVFKCSGQNISDIIAKIKSSNNKDRCLIELPNTLGLTDDILNSLPDNVDVRIIGGLTEEYSTSFKNDNMDFMREKATYSKQELKSIMSEINKIESQIEPQWNDYEKSLYLYEYLKSNTVYRKDTSLENGVPLDTRGNRNRTRTWDTLMGLDTHLSTCSGFSHMYRELCVRQGIDCKQIGGKYVTGREGDHAWNIVTIDGKNFLVDTIWDAQEYEKGNDVTTGFGTVDLSHYSPRCYREEHSKLTSLNPNWIEEARKKVSKNIPKELNAQEKINYFLQMREIDRKRMMELRGVQLSDLTAQQVNELESGGKSR